MITLFACPKPFLDPHIALIQRNAIASWVALRPRPTIILFGDEEGVAETSREFGIAHIPIVERNALGTPLMNDVFRQAEAIAPDSVLCYVNADIILMSDFIDAVRLCHSWHDLWMMGGRPWDVNIRQPLSFSETGQRHISDLVHESGVLRWRGACDYFVFTKGLWKNLPPMALGRSYFDLALLYLARNRGASLIDATDAITAVHQSHTYAPHLAGESYTTNPEAIENVRLAGGWEHIYTWGNATHRITPSGVHRFWPGTLRPWGHFSPTKRTIENRFWYPALAFTKPVRRSLGLGRDNLLTWSSRLGRLLRRSATMV